MSTDTWFEQAYRFMNNCHIPLSNDQKLKLYGLYKQATVGDCNTSKPSLFEFVGRAKWDAWNNLKGLSTTSAKEAYVDYVETLQVGWCRKGEYEVSPSKNAEEVSRRMGNVVSSLAHDGEEEEDDEDDLFGYARRNDLEKAKVLLSEDPQLVNSKDADGLSALHYAADRGHTDMAILLLGHGADVNLETNEQETPLHYACISEQREVAQLLIDHGCDLSIKNNDDQTALQLADDSFVSTLRIKE